MNVQNAFLLTSSRETVFWGKLTQNFQDPGKNYDRLLVTNLFPIVLYQLWHLRAAGNDPKTTGKTEL